MGHFKYKKYKLLTKRKIIEYAGEVLTFYYENVTQMNTTLTEFNTVHPAVRFTVGNK